MKSVLSLLLVFSINLAFGNKIQDAYKALSIYDYFKAKHLFYKSIKKNPAEASYGLATIYHRNDNPFSNIDSAAKYISISLNTFKDTATYSGYHLSKTTIKDLSHIIAIKGYNTYCINKSPKDINHYLIHFSFANDSILNESYSRRDKHLVEYYSSFNSSDSMLTFMDKYPESDYYPKALKQFYHLQYSEKVDESNVMQLKNFIRSYSKNPNVSIAESKLFELTKKLHNTDSLYIFIEEYSSNKTKEEAWKALYGESVKSYNAESLQAFLNKYPTYPYNESLIREISLAQNILIPFKNNEEQLGYIDLLGNWVIQAVYDDASTFEEGYAAVCKNDTCFYINKEGQKTFSAHFDEVENYKNGIAIVKKTGSFYLINKAGQFVSKGYQDISQSSNGLYVCQLNNLYGAINAKGEVIIPFIYNKLGNFKNGYAYYLTTAYGLVDINNNAMKAEWDWVSDVDSNLIVIAKKNNKFGLINVYETTLLQPEYDYITACSNHIYLVVKNNLYGFYNCKDKCFVSSIEFMYNSAHDGNYYSDGKYFTLIKEGEIGLMNANGKMLVNYGNYSNIFLTSQNTIRVQKNNKFGFIDKKLKAITPFDFESAKDFENDLAITTKSGASQLINLSGKAIYSIKGGFIYPLNKYYYKTSLNEMLGMITNSGELLLNNEFVMIEPLNDHLYRCKKTDGIYLFNTQNKTLKKL